MALTVAVVGAGCGRTALLTERSGGDAGADRGVVEDEDDGDDDDVVAIDCHEVDFLFVIDNSGSMYDHHTNLVDNVAVFTEGIEGVVAGGTDLHLGIVTTDVYDGTRDDCHVLGGLVTATRGAHSSEQLCGPFAAGNYITEADDVADAFACAAMVGTQGNDVERPMDALLAAIDDDGAAAQCNTGFLRPDALLVVVVVTDEWDGPGDPERDGSISGADTWRRSLAAAKGSDAGVVFVALVNEVPRQCSPGHAINDGTPLVEFAESLPFGFVGSICGDYAGTLGDALEVVAAACGG